MTVELFDGVTADLATTVAPSDGALDTQVYAAGNPDVDSAVITLAGKQIIGQFWVDGKQYGLQSIGGGVAAVYEVALRVPGRHRRGARPARARQRTERAGGTAGGG